MQAGIFLQEFGQALQGFVQHTASFTGLHHGDAEVVEHLGPAAHGRAEAATLIDLSGHGGEGAAEQGGFLLPMHQIKAAHDRHAGIDQGGKLVREQGFFLDTDFAFKQAAPLNRLRWLVGEHGLVAFFADQRGGENATAAQAASGFGGAGSFQGHFPHAAAAGGVGHQEGGHRFRGRRERGSG